MKENKKILYILYKIRKHIMSYWYEYLFAITFYLFIHFFVEKESQSFLNSEIGFVVGLIVLFLAFVVSWIARINHKDERKKKEIYQIKKSIIPIILIIISLFILVKLVVILSSNLTKFFKINNDPLSFFLPLVLLIVFLVILDKLKIKEKLFKK